MNTPLAECCITARLVRLNHIGMNQGAYDGGERFNRACSPPNRSEVQPTLCTHSYPDGDSNESLLGTKPDSTGGSRAISQRFAWICMGRSRACLVSLSLLVSVHHAQWKSGQDVRRLGTPRRDRLGVLFKIA